MSIDLSAYTESVIKSIGSKASPRVKKAFPLLIKKLHEFCIEADVTIEEWLETCKLLVEAGQGSSAARNEVILISDIFGIESLVDTLDHIRATKDSTGSEATHTAILGPFYRQGVPVQENGTSIIRQEEPGAPYCHLFGKVVDLQGKPIQGAIVDVWHDAPDGLYDSQSPDKPEYHCRGRFETDSDGRYDLICLRPTPYPIPYDQAAGTLLKMMDRHPYRPAHIHYMVQAKGCKSLVTQIFDSKSKYLEDDAVFAVKDNLVVEFVPISDDYQPPSGYENKMQYQLEYNITLPPASAKDELVVNGIVSAEPNGINGVH